MFISTFWAHYKPITHWACQWGDEVRENKKKDHLRTSYVLLLGVIEIVSHIKNFLPGDRVGVARMSETLWDVENLLRLGWTSSAASRPRKSASKCDFQEWPRKIHEFVQNIHKYSPNCQEAPLNRRDATALTQARVVD